MNALESMHLGIVGVGGRGSSFREACQSLGVRVHAVCDTDPHRLSEGAALFQASECYTDFAEMLKRSQLDAILIGTPMQLHAPQSIMALQHGVHVLCEVTPAEAVVWAPRRLLPEGS